MMRRMSGDPAPQTLTKDMVTAACAVAVTSLPAALLGYALFR